jgi:hypothetical protein
MAPIPEVENVLLIFWNCVLLEVVEGLYLLESSMLDP